MGNNKFKLSNMMPNAWFYKLKDMTKPKLKNKNTTKKPLPTSKPVKPDPPRIPDPPRRSSKRQSTSSFRRRKAVYNSSTETSSSSASMFDGETFLGLSSDCTCRLSSSTADIIIDLNTDKPSKHDVVSELGLPRIATRPINFDDTVFRATRPKMTPNHSAPGIKLRAKAKSPRLIRRVQSHARRSGAWVNGRAVVKSSVEPERDFMESMVEMIVENNIRASRDLEELLACYLSLNSKEYHDVIVKAFQQIWFDMAHIRL